jgi:diguanylate cyclase (GGDEF)-like protein
VTSRAEHLLAAAAELHTVAGDENVAQTLLRWSVELTGAAGGSVQLDGEPVRVEVGTPPAGAAPLRLPIRRRRQQLGTLELNVARRPAPGVRALVEMLAVCAAAALQHGQRFRDLEERSLTDPKTGTHNRRYLDRRLREEIDRAMAAGTAIGFIETDVDHMRDIKEAGGEASADRVLRAFALELQEWVGDAGVCGRHGGDEFCVILHDPTPESAREVGERIRAGAASGPLGGVRLTASVGVVVTEDPAQMSRLIELADRALYEAKEAGRNQVHVTLA